MAAAHAARLAEGGRVQSTDDILGTPQRAVHIRQHFVESGARVHLRFDRRELRFIQLAAFQLRGQAIHAAGDVAQMKAQRGEAMRPLPHLGGGKPSGVPRQIFARLLKPIQCGRPQRIHVRQRPAQPGFR